MIKNVLIFVGGYGKRLGNLTKKTPKPLLLINDKPFINYLLEKIIKIKPKKIIFLCKYKNSQFLLKYNKKKIHINRNGIGSRSWHTTGYTQTIC